MNLRPMQIPGRWREGYALDYHTLRSDFVGYDEYGHERFDTQRSEIGELLYRLKYRGDRSVVGELTAAVASFVGQRWPRVDMIVPVPPSRMRDPQPVLTISAALGEFLTLPVVPDCLTKAREAPELKNVHEYDERVRLLDGAFAVDEAKARGRTILLFDDLFRSGATMNAATTALYDQGGATTVFALALTRTRSRR